MNEKDISKYFDILGLEVGASHREVKQAYLDLVKVWHPDRFLNDPHLHTKTQEKLIQINEAYRHLGRYFSRHNNKIQTNRDGHDEPPPPQPTTPPAPVKYNRKKFIRIKKIKEPEEPTNFALYTTLIGVLIMLVVVLFLFIKFLSLFR